jgi:hypothetical protein
MSYRSLALAAAVGALSAMHIGSAAAQSVYVAPGGIYIGAGAGPVYVTPAAPINGAAAYVGPGYGNGYGTAAYGESDDDYGDVEPSYGYGYGPRPYVGPRYGYGYRPGPYVGPRYGYGYGPRPYVRPRYGYGYGSRPYVGPRYGYGYGPAVPNRRYYSGPRSAYAAALPPRPRVAVPYRAGRRF